MERKRSAAETITVIIFLVAAAWYLFIFVSSTVRYLSADPEARYASETAYALSLAGFVTGFRYLVTAAGCAVVGASLFMRKSTAAGAGFIVLAVSELSVNLYQVVYLLKFYGTKIIGVIHKAIPPITHIPPFLCAAAMITAAVFFFAKPHSSLKNVWFLPPVLYLSGHIISVFITSANLLGNPNGGKELLQTVLNISVISYAVTLLLTVGVFLACMLPGRKPDLCAAPDSGES